MFKWQNVLQKTLPPEVLEHLLCPFSENKIGAYDIPGGWLPSLAFKISFHIFFLLKQWGVWFWLLER